VSDTLSQVVALEGAKLLKLAEQPGELSLENLERLELLAKCTRALRSSKEAPGDDEEPEEEEAKLIERAGG
jgi:hypothetical protein